MYMNLKIKKFILKNKKMVAIGLLLLLLIHSSGVIRKTFTIIEGAEMKKEDIIKKRDSNLKEMRKMVKNMEKEEKKLLKKQKELGITEEEKRLTLKIIDKGIEMAEQMYGMMLFRDKGNPFPPPLTLFFSQSKYVKGKLESVFSDKKSMPIKVDENSTHQMDFFIDGIERMRKIRNTIAKLKTIDGGSESLPDKSSGESSEGSSKKSGSWF